MMGMIGLKVEFLPPSQAEERFHWVAICPEIDLATQGDTFEEAVEAIKDALHEWLCFCIEQGTLEEVLKECGFNHYRIEGIKNACQAVYALSQKKATVCHV